MKKIMILGASILQVPAILKAKELGYYVILIDMNSKAVGIQYADKFYEISTIDIDSILNIAKQENINGIITIASDMPMRAVAKVNDEMNLKGINYDVSLKATDKYLMRNALKYSKVPIPKYELINTYEDFLNKKEEFKYPFIIKPVDNSGSRGIYKFEHNISNYKEIYNYTVSNSRNGKILIEECMTGPEVSVEALTIDGITSIIAITDKLTTGAPHFVEMGHSQHSMLTKSIQEKIKKIVTNAITAIGINNSASHTELIITEEGPKVVEIGARLGGDNINTHLVPLSTGFNIVEAALKICIGDDVKIPILESKGAAIRYFNPTPGKILSIKGLENIKQIPGIYECNLDSNVGDYVKEIESSSDRIGYVIATANTPNKAIKICENAIKKVNIVTSNKK